MTATGAYQPKTAVFGPGSLPPDRRFGLQRLVFCVRGDVYAADSALPGRAAAAAELGSGAARELLFRAVPWLEKTRAVLPLRTVDRARSKGLT
jgi:hypothetical protein